MNYGICADCHFHNWTLFAETSAEGINSRLQSMIDELERLFITTQASGGKRIYICGDTFHVRGSIKPSVMNPVVQAMIRFTDMYKIQARIIPGNHDLEGVEVTFAGSSVVPLQHSTNDDEPEINVIHYPTFFEDDMTAVIPWQNTREGLRRVIEEVSLEITNDGYSLQQVDLLLHTGINGVIIGMPDHAWDAESLANFGFKRVFSGHYHQHKVFSFPKCEVVSIGSLTHQTWGDVGTIAGWIIARSDDFEQFEANTPKFMDAMEDYEAKDYKGNYVRVRGIELDESEIRQMKKAIEDMGAKGVVVHAVPSSKVTTRSGKSPGKAVIMEESIDTWITAEESIPKNNQKAVSKAALEILSMARSV